MGSFAGQQKDKAPEFQRRENTVNVRFSDAELDELDQLRGGQSRSEFLRDFSARQAGAAAPSEGQQRTGRLDIDSQISALFSIGEDLEQIRSHLYMLNQEQMMARWRAKDDAYEPPLSEDDRVFLDGVEDVIGLFKNVNLTMLKSYGSCESLYGFSAPMPQPLPLPLPRPL